jgi:signal transduction histidine kinase
VRRLLIGLMALLLGALQTAIAQGLPVLQLRASSNSMTTLEHLERYVDVTGLLNFEQVRQSEFSPVQHMRSAGFGSAVHWYRLRVQRSAADPETWILSMGEPYLDDVRVWIQQAGQAWQEVRLGDHVPFSQRSLPTPMHAVALSLPADTTVEIYVRVQSISALNFNAKLWEPAAFSQQESQFNFFQGLYFGLMALIVLINLMFGVWLRDGSMLSFAAYVLTLLLFFLAIHGYAAMFVQEGTPWLSDAVTGLGVMGGIAAAVYTWSRLLGLRERHPRIHQAYRLFAIGCLSLLVFSTSSVYSLIAPWVFQLSAVYMLVTLILAVMIWRETRYVEFGFYCAAIFCNVVGGFVQMGLPLGWLTVTPITEYAHQTLSLLQAFLMSLGLGIRIGKLRDERQRMEREMRLADQRASEQRRFVAMLSHEFRNPLAVIDRSAQMVLRNVPHMALGESQRMQNIRSGVAMLSTLVDSFLSTEAMQEAPMPLRVSRCNLRDFLELELASVGQDAQVRVQLHVDASVAECVLDRTLMGMALRNLLINALRYSPQDSPVELMAFERGGELVLAVADRGPGLSDQELQQLGQPYYRAAASAGKQGTGLGYHFSMRIVAAHEGRLEARNRPGGGLIVSVHVPLSNNASAW